MRNVVTYDMLCWITVILVVCKLVWNPSRFQLTTGFIWAQVREFDRFGDCFCTCALINWSVLWQSNHHYFCYLKPKSHVPTALHILQTHALWNNPSSSSIIPFSSNLQRKCQTAPSCLQAARRPVRTNCLPTTTPRRTSPPMTGCRLIIVLYGALRRRT